MARSPSQSDAPPLRRLQTVADLLETPALAGVYGHVLQAGPVTVGDVVDALDVPQGTAYDYVEKLQDAGLVEPVDDERPVEYDAEPLSLTLSTDGAEQTVTPSLVAAVARCDDDEDLGVFVERHGIDGLARALEYAFEYVDGTVTHRIAARELDLSSLEAEIVLQSLEPVARAFDDGDE